MGFDQGVRLSRLTESNRRPTHYEIEKLPLMASPNLG
jgi:hypothetical protein